MPPAPSGARISYGPSRVAGARGIAMSLPPDAGKMFARLDRMSQPRYATILLVAAGSGLAGGALAVRLFPVAPVFAEERHAKVIEAEEFRVVEKDGKPCGRFHVDRNGRPALFLFDKHGEVRAVLGVTPSGSPHLALSDKDGKVRATLGVWPDERAALFLNDK